MYLLIPIKSKKIKIWEFLFWLFLRQWKLCEDNSRVDLSQFFLGYISCPTTLFANRNTFCIFTIFFDNLSRSNSFCIAFYFFFA